MTEREKLSTELQNRFGLDIIDFIDLDGADIISFIINDRKRVVKPLEIMNSPNFPKMTSNGQLNALWEAGRQTLSNAGIDKE